MNVEKIKKDIEIIDRINDRLIRLSKEQSNTVKDETDIITEINLDCEDMLTLAIVLNIFKSYKDLEIMKENENRYKGLINLIKDVEEMFYRSISKDNPDINVELGIIHKVIYFLAILKSTLESKILEHKQLKKDVI